ncbi:MAG: sulfotransferase [Candidatus Theseobacter exili]|nr:sulfotransferase [Candidatus Theseobacter exili]
MILNDDYNVFGERWTTRFMKNYRKRAIDIPFLDRFIYFCLRVYCFFNKLITNMIIHDPTYMNKWYENKQVFFIFGVIRSGTAFLAHVLNKSENALVAHETVIDDYWYQVEAYQSEEKAFKYLSTTRRKKLYLMIKDNPNKIYGEINPFLRRFAKSVPKVFPEAKVLHLVRDGRDVVRSIMCRATFGKKDPLINKIVPDKNSFYYEKWTTMTRFEKVCWFWQNDTKYLDENTKYTVKLEKLRADYTYFKEKILDYLDLYVSKEDWEDIVNKPKNKSPVLSFPHWSEWNVEQKEAFNRICGVQMEKYDYASGWLNQ